MHNNAQELITAGSNYIVLLKNLEDYLESSCEILDIENQTGLSKSDLLEIKNISLANSNVEKSYSINFYFPK